jgi:hypothetical protein
MDVVHLTISVIEPASRRFESYQRQYLYSSQFLHFSSQRNYGNELNISPVYLYPWRIEADINSHEPSLRLIFQRPLWLVVKVSVMHAIEPSWVDIAREKEYEGSNPPEDIFLCRVAKFLIKQRNGYCAIPYPHFKDKLSQLRTCKQP